MASSKVENVQKMVKQRSLEALDKLRTYTTTPADSRRPSSTSVQMAMSSRARASRNELDPEVMDNATKFVQDIIEKAKEEAARKIDRESIGLITLRERKPEPAQTRWRKRAQSFAFRIYGVIFAWCNGR